jgi:hypothetical protein
MEKQKLTLVYVDGAAEVRMDNEEVRALLPEELEPLIDSVSVGGDLRKKIFLDDRNSDEPTDKEQYHYRLRIWSDYHYSTEICPRINKGSKESIDFVMVESIHKDVSLLFKTHELHVVLVFGDGDYRSIISTLLSDGISVSLIVTTPNAALYYSLSGRCEKCWALFKIDPKQETQFLGLGETCRALMERGAYFQASYAPESNALRVADGFLACSYVCKKCGETVLFSARTSHPCVRSKYAPPGLMTAPYRLQLSAMLTELTTEQLFDWCAQQHQRQVEADQLVKVFRSMEVIRWDVVQAIELMASVSSGMNTNIPSERLPQYKALLHAGVITWNTDRYIATEKQILLDGLREEVSSRLHYPNVAKRFSPEGALAEETLRIRVVERLSSATPMDRRTSSDQTHDEHRDLALEAILDPHLTPEKRLTLRKQLDEKHFINLWANWLEEFMRCTAVGDMLEMSEKILSEQGMATSHSIGIMVASGFLIFDGKREILRVNPKHVFCQTPVDMCKEVA